jgi:hypothetical protein
MAAALAAVPAWLSILAGVLGGMVFVGVHGFAGYLATKTIRYRVTGWAVAAVLVLLGLGVGTVLTYNASANAIAAQVGIGRCGP